MSIYYQWHEKIYAVVISWRSIREINYPKRVLHPATEDTCLAQPDLLLSPLQDHITLTSCRFLPEVTTLAGRSWSIPDTAPCSDLQLSRYIHWSLSDRIVLRDSIRFLASANREILAIITRSQADGNPSIEMIKVLDVQRSLYDTRIPFSGDFFLTWPRWRDLHLQRFSWEIKVAQASPVACFKVLPMREPAFQLMDVVAGRILAADSKGLALLDFTLPPA